MLPISLTRRVPAKHWVRPRRLGFLQPGDSYSHGSPTRHPLLLVGRQRPALGGMRLRLGSLEERRASESLDRRELVGR